MDVALREEQIVDILGKNMRDPPLIADHLDRSMQSRDRQRPTDLRKGPWDHEDARTDHKRGDEEKQEADEADREASRAAHVSVTAMGIMLPRANQSIRIAGPKSWSAYDVTLPGIRETSLARCVVDSEMMDQSTLNSLRAGPLRTRQVRAAIVSIAAGLGILGLKYVALLLTGSVALLSDTAESVVNVIAANVVLISLAIAVRPPDAGHPYGHGKAEYISSATEAGLISLVSVWIVVTAIQRLVRPVPLHYLDWGLFILALATVANYLTGRFLLRVSRAVNSIALEVDAKHLLVDVLTSLGVFLGLGLARLTGAYWLDPLVGAIVAVNILSIGIGLFRRSVGGLMDTSLPPEEEARIRAILNAHDQEIVDYHALRARRAGAARFLDLHLILHRTLSVGQAHALCDHLEAHIQEELPGTDVTIHVEPCGPTCPRCGGGVS